MTYPLPGTFVNDSTVVPVSAGNLNEYTTAITGLDTRTTAVESGKAPTSRLITTGNGLSGGGNLTADRTLIVVGDTTTQRVELAKNGTQVGSNARKRINLIEGTNVTITAADNSGSNQLDVTIAAAGGSGGSSAIATKTTNYTITGGDHTILGNAAGGAITITLLTAVGQSGITYHVKRINSGSNTVTVATTSSQTIDGATTQVLVNQYDALTVVSDGANWFIV